MKQRILIYSGFLFFGLITLIALLSTVLPFIQLKQWYFRVFDYPRLQTFVLALLALAWFLVFYYKKSRLSFVAIFILSAVIIVQAYKAIPYTFLGKKQVLWSENDQADTTTVSFFICNVLQTNTAYDDVMRQIAIYNPEVVITTETDHKWEKGLSAIEKKFRYQVAVPQSNTYGMHLYSQLPLRQTSVRNVMEPEIPSIKTQLRLRSGEWIQLYVLHPKPPVPGEDKDSKSRDAEIITIGREAKKDTGGVIVAGDFNDVAWSATTALFQEVSGLLDPRRGRGFYNTYHAKIPIFRWPLDHIFHSNHFKLIEIKRAGKVGSDHFPMYIKLSYEPGEKADQEAVKPEADTKEKAAETIQKGKE